MQLVLFAVLLIEAGVMMALSFKTPIRELLIRSLDRAKRGHGPVVIRSASATVFVVLVTSVHSIMKIQKRSNEDGAMNPADEIIMAKHILESTLMGAVLFLGLMINRLHHYMMELRKRKTTLENMKKEGAILEGVKARVSDEDSLKDDIMSLWGRRNQLTYELAARSKEICTEETRGDVLQKQSERFLTESNRLHKENQDLRDQLQTVESKISRSSINKNT